MNLLFITAFTLTCLHAACFCVNMEPHLKPIHDHAMRSSLPNIDFIYLINLDQRPEKLEHVKRQLHPYGIFPCRFPAIYGWGLSPEVLNDIGLTYLPGMEEDEWCIHFPLDGDGEFQIDFLTDQSVNKTYFSRWISRGAIGCTLSHLSVLEDAWKAGHELIWVMEDDVVVIKDPRYLSELITKLDSLVGREGWDVLYTDIDTADAPLYNALNTFEKDLNGHLWIWRPDMASKDLTPYRRREILSQDFLKIGTRMRTHSMLITRSGIEKILAYEKSHGIFIPYDHELSMVPGIQLYSLRYPLVTFVDRFSDTRTQHFQP